MRCYSGKISSTLPLQEDSTYVLLEKTNTLYVYVKDKYVIKIITEPYIFLTEDQNFFITGVNREVISEEKYKKYFLSERFRSGFGKGLKGDKGQRGPDGNKGSKGKTGNIGNPATNVPINTLTYQTKDDVHKKGELIRYNGEELDSQGRHIIKYVSEDGSFCRINDTIHDCDGNRIICGYFNNSLTLGDFQLQTGIIRNGFIAMIRSDNHVMWALQMNSNYDCEAVGITLDCNKNLYVTGTLIYQATFGNIIKNVVHGKHTFVAVVEYTNTTAKWKLVFTTRTDKIADSNENDTSAYVEVCGIVYVMGKVVISGRAHGYIALLDNHFSSFDHINNHAYNKKYIANTSLYVSIIDPFVVVGPNQQNMHEEDNIWYFIPIANTNNVYAQSITAYDNNIYVGGILQNRIFIQKFKYADKELFSLWKINTQQPFVIMKITVDAFENIYIAGYYTGSFEISDLFIKREGIVRQKTAFFAKLNNVGAWEAFADIIDTESMITGIVVDLEQNIYICGDHSENLTLNVIDGEIIIPTDVYASCFLCKISRYGQWQWAMKIPTSFYAATIDIDPDKNLHLVGSYLFANQITKIGYNKVINTLPLAIIQEKDSTNTTISFIKGRLFDVNNLIIGKNYSINLKSSTVQVEYGYMNKCKCKKEQNTIIGIAVSTNSLLVNYL